ncbi:MAG: tetratricopeptide repeat protein [Candidatus Eremiobacteraeota bacterium]|nr:tetratricopeptide repeat protein [Candidatus Eremiobacteraeota bacterium]
MSLFEKYFGKQTLLEALQKNDLKTARRIVDSGNFDTAERASDGTTVLILASMHGDPHIIKALLDHGADPNEAGQRGVAPLHACANTGNIECAKLLIEKGADVNSRTTGQKESVLYYALRKNHGAMVELLLSSGADPREMLRFEIMKKGQEAYKVHMSGDLALAERLYHEAIARAGAELGPHDFSTAELRHYHADILRDSGRIREAEAVYLQVLEDYRAALSPDDHRIGTCYHDLCGVCLERREYEKALEYCSKGLSIRMAQAVGDERVLQLAQSLNVYGQICIELNAMEEANKHLVQALNLRAEILGRLHPDSQLTLNNVAHMYARQGQADKAQGLLEAIRTAAHQSNDPIHPKLLLNLGDLYRDAARVQEARDVYNEALFLAEQHFGPNCDDAMDARKSLAGLNVN